MIPGETSFSSKTIFTNILKNRYLTSLLGMLEYYSFEKYNYLAQVNLTASHYADSDTWKRSWKIKQRQMEQNNKRSIWKICYKKCLGLRYEFLWY